ncbi:MAG: hypothetical protein J2P46_18175, partial [Zavarzinella sp.]|nr:hypothetical protein [Zavarzinella sp.]
TRKLLRSYALAEDEGGSGFENIALSRDGKIVLVTGSIVGKDQATTGFSGSPPAEGWVRVLEVDSGKELFNSRTEKSEGLFSTAVHLSRDGRKLVTLETQSPGAEPRYSRVKVWDLSAAEKQPLVIKATFVQGFNPDGSRLLGGRVEDGKTKQQVWDTATGQEISGIEFPFERFTGPILTGFSPDGSLMAAVTSVPAGKNEAGSTQLKRALRVQDANTGKEIFSFDLDTLPGFQRGSAPVFTNDGSRVAVSRPVRSSAANTEVRWEWLIFDTKSWKLLTSFDEPGYESGRFGLLTPTRMFSDDGRQFICAVENTVYTFDSTNGQPVHTLRGNENPISHMVALPSGRLRTVETGGAIREWDLRPVEPVRTAFVEERRTAGSGPGRFVSSVRPRETAISADGAWIARYIPAADPDDPAESVRVWDTAGTATPIELTPPPRVSPKGLKEVFPLRFPQLSADGKRVALFRGELTFRGTNPKQPKIDQATIPSSDVTVWDVASRKVLFHHELQPQDGPAGLGLNRVGLSPDGATIAILDRVSDQATVTSTLTLFDLAAGDPRSKIEVADSVAGFSFSPDGRRIAVGMTGPQNDGPFRPLLRQIAVLDASTGERISAIEADTLAAPNGIPSLTIMAGLAWSPDGSRLAIAQPGSSRIHLFDVATGKRVQTLDASIRGGLVPSAPGGGQLTFSPDGRRIACVVSQRVDRRLYVNVLDTDSGRQVLSLPLPLNDTRRGGGTLRFSPDGHRLIHFELGYAFASGPPAPAQPGSHVQVTTWDATPRPEAKQP